MDKDLRQIKNQILDKSSCSNQDIDLIESALYDGEGITLEKGR